VTGGTVQAATPVAVSGSGASYTVTISGITGIGTLGLNLVANGSIHDGAGNTLGGQSGNLAFMTEPVLQAGTRPPAVTIGDVSSDGMPDLVVVNTSNNTAGVFLGNGDGAFQTQQTFATGLQPTAVALGDLNDDNKPDLVVVNGGDNT